jgi:DNA-binding NarL/FixJ family response regulator
MSRLTVAIVDDHEIVRDGVEAYIERACPEAQVVASVGTVAEMLAGPVPDVVILDLVLREGQSLHEVPDLVARGIRVLLYTSEERPVPLRRAVELGVSGVLLKGDPVSTINEGLTMAMDGQFYVSGPLAHALITDPALVSDLSEQQRQVLQCIDEGLDYRATARVMNISGNTVKEYLSRIRDKFRERGFHPGNSHHLTRLAQEEGHIG